MQSEKEFPAHIKTLIVQAVQTERQGDFAGAIALHKKILQLQSKNVYSMNSIAGLYGLMGEYDNEVVWAQKALSINPKYDLAYINMGNGMLGRGQVVEAKAAYEQGLKINPKSAAADYSLGVFYDSQRNLNLAIQYYQKALKLDAQFENAYFNIAVDYANLKHYDEAIKVLNQLLKINPNDADAKMMLVEIAKHK